MSDEDSNIGGLHQNWKYDATSHRCISGCSTSLFGDRTRMWSTTIFWNYCWDRWRYRCRYLEWIAVGGQRTCCWTGRHCLECHSGPRRL